MDLVKAVACAHGCFTAAFHSNMVKLVPFSIVFPCLNLFTVFPLNYLASLAFYHHSVSAWEGCRGDSMSPPWPCHTQKVRETRHSSYSNLGAAFPISRTERVLATGLLVPDRGLHKIQMPWVWISSALSVPSMFLEQLNNLWRGRIIKHHLNFLLVWPLHICVPEPNSCT